MFQFKEKCGEIATKHGFTILVEDEKVYLVSSKKDFFMDWSSWQSVYCELRKTRNPISKDEISPI
jgi:hypothetical protein